VIFRQLFQERFTIGIVDHEAVERRWLMDRIPLDGVCFKEFGSITDVLQNRQSEPLDVLLVSLAGREGTSFDVLLGLHGELPRCALILLDDFDDGRLSHLATRVQCQDVLLKGDLTAATLTRSVLFSLHRHRSRLEAERLRREAEELAKAKADFASMVSHEILNPMTGILGYLDILRRTELTAPQKSYVSTVRSSCQSLSALVKDLLSFTKLDQGVVTTKLTAFSPFELLLDLERQLRGQNENPEVRVIAHCDPHLPSVVYGDRIKLRQVAFNLAQNALKFTTRGQVALLLRRLDEDDTGFRVRLAVEDSGIGIPSDKLDTIAEPFCQARSEDSRRGHGLGLAIVSKLLGVLRSRLRVQSIEGQGTVFWADLLVLKDRAGTFLDKPLAGKRVVIVDDNPLARAYVKESVGALGGQVVEIFSTDWPSRAVDVLLVHTEHPACSELLAQSTGQIPHRFVYGCDYEEQLADGTWQIEGSCYPHRMSEFLRATPLFEQNPKPVATYRGRALVVDDDIICRNYLVHELTRLGFVVDPAENGRKALEKVELQKYDLLAIDGHLGDTTGPILYRRMRREGLISDQTVVLIVTGDPESWRGRVRESDRRVHIAGKPIGTRELAELLPAAFSECPFFDTERLERLAALGAPAMQRLFQTFQENLPSMLANLEDAIVAGDQNGVYQTAHRLKGACATVGLSEIARCASALEEESANPTCWGTWHTRIRTAAEAVDIDRILKGGIGPETAGSDIAI
jgi:signal transduction histidine kinase/HPt (histidine-containing phosphotransfer) domain-containing protein